MLGPIIPSFGPPSARIAIVGECPGEEETRLGRPFVGPSGNELRRELRAIGVDLDACYVMNVFNQRAPGNDVPLAYGVDKPSAASRALGPLSTNPTRYLADEHFPHLERCRAELAAVSPNVIIALGNTATWLLLGQLGINTLRGTVHLTDLPGRPTKVVPTYHPAAVLRQWSLRTVAITDLEKARLESLTPEVNYDDAEIWVEPNGEDLDTFGARFMENATILSCDIETRAKQITCIGFAPSNDRAIVVPFWNKRDVNYWSEADEMKAWRWVQKWLECPIPKVFQNGLFDLQYLAMMGFKPRNCTEDTMLAHHSLYSELPKNLRFLGSTMTNFPSWKSMRKQRTKDVLKRDE